MFNEERIANELRRLRITAPIWRLSLIQQSVQYTFGALVMRDNALDPLVVQIVDVLRGQKQPVPFDTIATTIGGSDRALRRMCATILLVLTRKDYVLHDSASNTFHMIHSSALDKLSPAVVAEEHRLWYYFRSDEMYDQPRGRTGATATHIAEHTSNGSWHKERVHTNDLDRIQVHAKRAFGTHFIREARERMQEIDSGRAREESLQRSRLLTPSQHALDISVLAERPEDYWKLSACVFYQPMPHVAPKVLVLEPSGQIDAAYTRAIEKDNGLFAMLSKLADEDPVLTARLS